LSTNAYTDLINKSLSTLLFFKNIFANSNKALYSVYSQRREVNNTGFITTITPVLKKNLFFGLSQDLIFSIHGPFSVTQYWFYFFGCAACMLLFTIQDCQGRRCYCCYQYDLADVFFCNSVSTTAMLKTFLMNFGIYDVFNIVSEI
jgi:hypothetical protein